MKGVFLYLVGMTGFDRPLRCRSRAASLPTLCGRLRTTAYSRIHRILSLTAVPPRGSNPLLSVKIRQQKQGINPAFVVYEL